VKRAGKMPDTQAALRAATLLHRSEANPKTPAGRQMTATAHGIGRAV
jgi:hypothetical protein